MTKSLPKVYPSSAKAQEQSSSSHSFLHRTPQKHRVILSYPDEKDVYLNYHFSRGGIPSLVNLEFAL